MHTKWKIAFCIAGVCVALGIALMIVSFVALGSDTSLVSYSIGFDNIVFDAPPAPKAPSFSLSFLDLVSQVMSL